MTFSDGPARKADGRVSAPAVTPPPNGRSNSILIVRVAPAVRPGIYLGFVGGTADT
jgi:hypothetical protein